VVTNWENKLGDSISVGVEYYNEEHREALQSYPTARKIQEVVKQGIVVPVPEFLTYFLFHKIRSVPSLRSGYSAVREAISHSYGMLSDFVNLEDGFLYLSGEALMLPGYVTEYIGESVALSVMNRVHGVTEADWVPIPKPSEGKFLDYELASSGTQKIQVEAKGSVVEDVALKSNSISNQKLSIEQKKGGTDDGLKGSLRYGAITAIPSGPQALKCWLLDPPPVDDEREPRDLRIIARLRFLRWIIWLVSPRSHLATALANRARDAEALRQPYELSGIPLANADGSPLEISYNIARYRTFAAFFGSRSRVDDGPAGGVVVPLPKRNGLLFIGFRENLLELAAVQNFDEITTYSAPVAALRKRVLCTVSAREFDTFRIQPENLPRFRKSGGYVHFELEGTLAYSQEGLVFGVLPVQYGEKSSTSDDSWKL
jgi:hypothetical protein